MLLWHVRGFGACLMCMSCILSLRPWIIHLGMCCSACCCHVEARTAVGCCPSPYYWECLLHVSTIVETWPVSQFVSFVMTTWPAACLLLFSEGGPKGSGCPLA
jgi:hypothetical protein